MNAVSNRIAMKLISQVNSLQVDLLLADMVRFGRHRDDECLDLGDRQVVRARMGLAKLLNVSFE